MQHSDLSDDARSAVLARFSRSLEAALHPAASAPDEAADAGRGGRGSSSSRQVRHGAGWEFNLLRLPIWSPQLC